MQLLLLRPPKMEQKTNLLEAVCVGWEATWSGSMDNPGVEHAMLSNSTQMQNINEAIVYISHITTPNRRPGGYI